MAFASIDEYIEQTEEPGREALERLRAQIKASVPGGQECISYGQPAFRQGRVVCGFGATKKHCALYMFSGTVLSGFTDELVGYDVSKGTVRFHPEKPLPEKLVRKLVEARLAECSALDAARKKTS